MVAAASRAEVFGTLGWQRQRPRFLRTGGRGLLYFGHAGFCTGIFPRCEAALWGCFGCRDRTPGLFRRGPRVNIGWSAGAIRHVSCRGHTAEPGEIRTPQHRFWDLFAQSIELPAFGRVVSRCARALGFRTPGAVSASARPRVDDAAAGPWRSARSPAAWQTLPFSALK
jgi:hypothetical protein